MTPLFLFSVSCSLKSATPYKMIPPWKVAAMFNTECLTCDGGSWSPPKVLSHPPKSAIPPLSYYSSLTHCCLKPLSSEIFRYNPRYIGSHHLPTHRRGVHRNFFMIPSFLNEILIYTVTIFAVVHQWVKARIL